MSQGWECPQCGKVNAPWVAWCDHYTPVGISTGSGTGSTARPDGGPPAESQQHYFGLEEK